jgi:hypothetical protein
MEKSQVQQAASRMSHRLYGKRITEAKEEKMAKKGLLVLVLACVLEGSVFAQEKTTDVDKFWLSGEVSLVGVGARAEYMLTPKFSVGLNAYWTSLIFIFNDIGVNAVGRFYPWGKIFYAGLGLGFAIHTGIEDFKKDGEKYDNDGDTLISRTGFGVVPEIGWKIDLGKPGEFFLNPHAQFPITLGTQEAWGETGDFGVSVGFRAALGLGWAF